MWGEGGHGTALQSSGPAGHQGWQRGGKVPGPRTRKERNSGPSLTPKSPFLFFFLCHPASCSKCPGVCEHGLEGITCSASLGAFRSGLPLSKRIAGMGGSPCPAPPVALPRGVPSWPGAELTPAWVECASLCPARPWPPRAARCGRARAERGCRVWYTHRRAHTCSRAGLCQAVCHRIILWRFLHLRILNPPLLREEEKTFPHSTPAMQMVEQGPNHEGCHHCQLSDSMTKSKTKQLGGGGAERMNITLDTSEK